MRDPLRHQIRAFESRANALRKTFFYFLYGVLTVTVEPFRRLEYGLYCVERFACTGPYWYQ